MKNDIYKVYAPDGKPWIFENLSELKQTFDLSEKDTKLCFQKSVHTTKEGFEVIHYYD